mgnify:CR=1 FL=1
MIARVLEFLEAGPVIPSVIKLVSLDGFVDVREEIVA